jgi:hypothetical protein
VVGAVHEFGRPAEVIEAFARNSPGRREAVRLLATGPVFALLWDSSRMTSRAWTWPVPRPLEIAFCTLLAVVGVLVTVLATTHPAKTRRAGHAHLGHGYRDRCQPHPGRRADTETPEHPGRLISPPGRAMHLGNESVWLRAKSSTRELERYGFGGRTGLEPREGDHPTITQDRVIVGW